MKTKTLILALFLMITNISFSQELKYNYNIVPTWEKTFTEKYVMPGLVITTFLFLQYNGHNMTETQRNIVATSFFISEGICIASISIGKKRRKRL